MTTKLYLDDERMTPDGWERVYTAHEAIAALRTGTITHISLDHDLGDLDGDCGDGYDVACFIEAGAYHGTLPKLVWAIHSANPVGAQRMKEALQAADRFWALGWSDD